MIIPTGAIVAALFTFSCGIVFISKVLAPNSIASMQPVFEFAAWLLLLLCPAITMRLIAEERRVGTWELLLSSPVTSYELAKGKFLSALLFLFLILLSTFPLILVLELYSSVDYGAVASGYFGLLLLGSAVIGTGLVISALTTSQTVAYLVTAFVWLTLSLSMKVLPVYVPTRFADVFFAIDPDLRIASFSSGLIDSANIVYFLAIALATGWIVILGIERTRQATTSAWKIVLCSGLLIISIIAVNNLSLNNHLRFRLDATGTRSYTLSNQTSLLLDELDAPWKIVVLIDENQASKPVLSQVDEVLRRYEKGSPFINVQRINPADPDSIESYDELLRDLVELYGDELKTAEFAIKEGAYQFSMLITFASSTSAWAESLMELQLTSQEQDTLQALIGALSLLGSEGHLILDEVNKAMRVNEGQPLPQISFARDILVAAAGQWSQELAEVALWLNQGRSESIAPFCSKEAIQFELIAAKLAEVDERLRRLGTLELGQLAAQLTLGEGAIILSPHRATMIPSSVLFPKNLSGTQSIAVDRRFRGEQIISSAMRSLQSNVLPTVVFVHAEETSLLGQRPNNIDVRAVTGLLESSRFGVEEWIPSDTPRPNIEEGPVVWIVIPPTNRAGIEPTPREQTLLGAVYSLLADNQPIMLNIQPSLLPRYGHKDPWDTLAGSLGVSIDSEHVLVERVAVGQNALELQRGQMIANTNSEHLISRAVDGRQIYLPLPIALQGGESLITIMPSEDRWLDQQWEREIADIESKEPLETEISIATAVENKNGGRSIVIGSGGWLLSWVADRAVSIGGNQVAMLNPGNSELFLAAVEWLAGLDGWIAAGPIGQQSTRVEGLSENMYLTWAIILVIGIPASLVGTVTIVTIRRYRR